MGGRGSSSGNSKSGRNNSLLSKKYTRKDVTGMSRSTLERIAYEIGYQSALKYGASHDSASRMAATVGTRSTAELRKTVNAYYKRNK